MTPHTTWTYPQRLYEGAGKKITWIVKQVDENGECLQQHPFTDYDQAITFYHQQIK